MPPSIFPGKGIYAITQDFETDRDRLYAQVEMALEGGVVAVQYRAKNGRANDEEATELLQCCARFGVPLIINDDPVMAARIGAQGVHLGKADAELTSARAMLGPDAILGVSCYDQVGRAIEAEKLGADYVAFGRFYPSLTKPEAKCAAVGTLESARKLITLPIVAIGGITAENGTTLLEHGADLLAVVEGLFGHADCRARARLLSLLWSSSGDFH